MSTTTDTAPKNQKPRDWPIYWFAELERAIELGDFELAAKAQKEMERLGVTVRYRLRGDAKGVASGH